MGTGLQFLPQRKPTQLLLHPAGGGGMGKSPMKFILVFKLKDPTQGHHRDFNHFRSHLFPIWSQVVYFVHQSLLNFPGWAGTFQVFHFLHHTVGQGQLPHPSHPSSCGRISAMHHPITTFNKHSHPIVGVAPVLQWGGWSVETRSESLRVAWLVIQESYFSLAISQGLRVLSTLFPPNYDMPWSLQIFILYQR